MSTTEPAAQERDEEPTLITDADIDPFAPQAATEAPKDAKTLLTINDLRMYFPVKSQGLTACPSKSSRAARWAWSGSRAVASRRPGG